MFAKFRTCCQYVIVSLQFVILVFTALFFTASASAQTVILRVDGPSGSATPAGQGNDWGSNAYKYLPDAIDRADFLLNNSLATSVQLWVRAGTYYPDEGHDGNGDPLPANERSLTFELHNNVGIYGGFAGTELANESRDSHYFFTA